MRSRTLANFICLWFTRIDYFIHTHLVFVVFNTWECVLIIIISSCVFFFLFICTNFSCVIFNSVIVYEGQKKRGEWCVIHNFNLYHIFVYAYDIVCVCGMIFFPLVCLYACMYHKHVNANTTINIPSSRNVFHKAIILSPHISTQAQSRQA